MTPTLPSIRSPKPYKRRPLTIRGLMKQKVALKFTGLGSRNEPTQIATIKPTIRPVTLKKLPTA
jgi:hypothetical protein